MGAQRAAWVAAFAVESAAAAGADFAATLLDLVKAFERIPYDKLVAAARRLGYPLRLLRLSIAAYRLMRTVIVGGTCSRVLQATRGITAGSAHATTELRLLLIQVVRDTLTQWPLVQLYLYVDDLTITARGGSFGVVRQVREATAFIIGRLEGALQLQVSDDKSMTVASRVRITRAVGRGRFAKRLKLKRAVRMLGATLAPGRRRSTRVGDNRLATMRERTGRIKAFRTAGGAATTYVRVAATPMMLYGVDVNGISDAKLSGARKSAAAAISPDGGGRNFDVALHVAAAEGREADPALLAHTSPLTRWVTAWWEQWVPSEALQQAMAAAIKRFEGKQSLSLIHI